MSQSNHLRILLMEDAELMAEVIRKHLEKAGHHVVHARDGCEGLHMYNSGLFDLLLIDQEMPNLTGLDVMRVLAEQGPLPPTIIVTGTDEASLAVTALKLGAGDYLVKTTGRAFLDLLLTAVERLFREHRLAEAKQRAEKALRKSEARTRIILDSAGDAIISINEHGIIESFNAEAERMFGYSAAAAIGENVAMLVPPTLREQHTHGFGRYLTTGKAAVIGRGAVEVEGLRQDGIRFPIELTLSELRTEDERIFTGIIRDLSKRREAEEALRASEECYRLLANRALDIIWTTDPAGRITYVSPSLEKVLGYTPGEVVGRDFAEDILTPDSLEAVAEIFERIKAGKLDDILFEAKYLSKTGRTVWCEISATMIRDAAGQLQSIQGITRDVSKRKHAESERDRLATAVTHTADSIVITDLRGAIEYVNLAFERMSGYTRAEVIGRNPRLLQSGNQDAAYYEDLWRTITGGEVWRGHFRNRRKDGTLYDVEATITPVCDGRGHIVNYVGVQRDVTEEVHLKAQLLQAQKLEAVGALAAGIAHEINTPIQFVSDNTHFLQEAFGDLLGLLRAYQELKPAGSSDAAMAEALVRVHAVEAEADLEYLVAEIPKAVEQTLEGLERVAKIVRAMKEFSHPDTSEDGALANLNNALETTLTVARNELKYVADVVTDFDANLPPVHCYVNELNQVFLNLLVNAAHAIAEAGDNDDTPKGIITIRTRTEGDEVVVTITDTGVGIPEAIRDRVYEPFFTTKEVGRGTGQGLAIAHAVVVEKHGGALSFDSVEGEGTTFYLRLPLRPVQTSHAN